MKVKKRALFHIVVLNASCPFRKSRLEREEGNEREGKGFKITTDGFQDERYIIEGDGEAENHLYLLP